MNKNTEHKETHHEEHLGMVRLARSVHDPGGDFDREEEKKSRMVFRVLRIVVAFSAIIGLLYISGAQQYFFYRKTPDSVRQEPVSSVVDAETLTVHLTVFLLTNDESDGSRRSPEDARRLVVDASEIWKQAGIQLVVEELFILEKSDRELELFFTSPFLFMDSIEKFNRSNINVFLVGNLKGINGISFTGSNAVAVADYTTVYDFRALAHEVGHALGLDHVAEGGRLMYRGANYFNLTLEEIIHARRSPLF